MQTLGKNSLLVYWVHVMLVYGKVLQPFKHGLGVLPTALVTAAVTALMVALSAGWMRWKVAPAQPVRLRSCPPHQEARPPKPGNPRVGRSRKTMARPTKCWNGSR